MPGPSVLLDTNILISGLVFSKGNEHIILKMAEEGEITLVLPEFVRKEAERVLAERFAGYEALLDVFLSRLSYTFVGWDDLEGLLPRCFGRVRDRKDVPFLAAILVSRPEFAVTGDKELREDLNGCEEISGTKICSSKEFLEEFKEHIEKVESLNIKMIKFNAEGV